MPEKTKAQIREKFADETYPIHVIGRHLSVTEPMKAYAVDKFKKMERYGGRVMDLTITMDIQKAMHSVDYVLHINDYKVKVSGRSENMYASIDLAIEHLQAKLRRYMRKLHEHRALGIEEIEMNVNVIQRISPLDDVNDQIEEETLRKKEKEYAPPKIVNQEKKPLKVLNQEEAIMKMELSEDAFMLYTSEEDRKLKVIYRRDDGNYGIIEPQK